MLTRRALLKVMATLGFSAMLPGKIFGETLALAHVSPGGDTQGPSAACQFDSQGMPGEAASPHEIEAGEALLDSVDCMELAEQYGSFEKVGGYLGGFLAGRCPFCRTGDCYVYPNEFRCDKWEISGTTLDFFAKVEGIKGEEAMCRLAVLVKSWTLQRRRNEQKVLWDIMSEASWYYHHLLCDTAEGKPGRERLQEQGVTAHMREKHCLGYFPRCPNGVKAELIQHLIGQGYESDIVQSAILPAGRPGILLPVRDDRGHYWGFLKAKSSDQDQALPCYSLLGMQRLAPLRFERLSSNRVDWASLVSEPRTCLASLCNGLNGLQRRN